MLDVPIPQTMDAMVGMVDEMVVFIVQAVAGCDEFSCSRKSRLMSLLLMLARFLVLCSGMGVFPREYALA